MVTPNRIKITFAAFIASMLFLLAAAIASSNLVSAVGEGQIEGGDIYYSRNLTDGTSFADPTAVDKCEILQYKVRLHNPGASPVTNVNVQVSLPVGASTQNVSTMTASATDAFPTTRSDTATVNLSDSLAISYISGSTELLNSSNSVISGLPDGIVNGGVNIGTVGVSINEIRFVQFKAKVDCPTVCVDNPQTPEDECNPCVDNPSTPENECVPTQPPTPTPPPTVTTVTTLPDTGPGAVIATFLGVSGISSAIYYVVARRFGL